MIAWQFGRIVVVLVVVALTTWAALSAVAQAPAEPKPLPRSVGPQTDLPPRAEPGSPPSAPDTNSDVQPAQFSRPASTSTPPTPPITIPTRPVPDPPAPVVRIQVRVPADAPPDDTLKYTITIQNTSQAEAHQVTVRNPLPAGVEGMVKAEPKPDNEIKTSDVRKEIVWTFGTLKPGEKKTIELVLKTKAGATEVKNLAYVRFEHGEAVTTRLSQPDVKVTKVAPKQAMKDEPYQVRVTIENRGRVPAEKVRLVEDVNRAALVESVTEGGQRTATSGAGTNQWQWEIGTLLPGQRKVVEYQVTPRTAGEALATTNVSAEKSVHAREEARTEVLAPGLGLELKGPTGPIHPGEEAEYEIVVHNNEGTAVHTNVRVTGSIPVGCKPTSKTAEGQLIPGAVVWTIPRLEPKKAYAFRYKLRVETTGHQTVTASVVDSRKFKDIKTTQTFFEGMVALVWETHPDPGPLATGQQGGFTIVVRNNGGDAAADVRVTVDLPPEVVFVQGSPNGHMSEGKVTFGPDTIRGHGETTYIVTYKATRGGNARFKAVLAAKALKDPLTAEKVVTITNGK